MKKLYEHFVESGNKEEAEKILKIYPQFNKVEEKPKSKK